MFSTTSQAAMNHNLLGELAASGVLSDPVLFIHGVLVAFAVATLLTGYLFFGRSGERTLKL
jgi:hypothetical protein